VSGVLRAGIIGTGFIGAVHAHAVRAGGHEVARVAASTSDRARAAAARLGAAAPASSAEELIDADDVDVVHVCTPNTLHAPLAHRALAAGKPVLCEKPLATTVDDARSLTEAARRAGVVATVPFVYRFYPTVRDARAGVLGGEIGRPHLLHGHYLQDWQAGGGDPGWRGEAEQGGAFRAFADVGVHWCDLAEFVTGQRITRLIARTGESGSRTTMLFETDGVAAGSVVISQASPGNRNRLEFTVDGPELSYSFDQQHPDELRIGGVAENRTRYRGDPGQHPAAARYSLTPPGHPHGYQDCFNAFVADSYAAIRGEAPDGLPTFADGLRVALLTKAVADSANTSAWTDVDPA
jgi:predicted dehydrogenase